MKRNSSKPKRRYGDAGFTLVELVVVIAVLAILAGVGAVAYNGYIEYAHKGVDRQTVGEIIHALELADYADPTLFGENPHGSVLLHQAGVTASDDGVNRALEDAGINQSLSYADWEGAIDAEQFKTNVLQKIVEELPFVDGSTVRIGYADIADECWAAVKAATDKMTELATSSEIQMSGDPEKLMPGLVLLAAKNSTSTDWTGTIDHTQNLAQNLPTIAARNYAFAAYLESNYGDYEGKDKDLAKLRSIQDALLDPTELVDENLSGVSETYKQAVKAYLKNEVYKDNDGNSHSQAWVDAQGYNTFMKAVDTQYGSLLQNTGKKDSSGKDILEFTGDPQTFWNEAGSFISGAAQAVNMDQTSRQNYLNSLPASGKGILVTISGRSTDGTLNINVYPPEAKPTDSSKSSASTTPEPGTEGACSQPHTSKANISVAGGRSGKESLILTVTVDGKTKQVGGQESDNLGSIYLCSTEEVHKTLGVDIGWGVSNKLPDCTKSNLTISVEGDAATYVNGTLTAVKSGTATLKVKLSYDGLNLEIDIPIEVH